MKNADFRILVRIEIIEVRRVPVIVQYFFLGICFRIKLEDITECIYTEKVPLTRALIIGKMVFVFIT